MTNCPNCGAPINPYSVKCEYCGTICFDFTAIDLESDKPVFVKIRTHMGTITSLAIPNLETISMDYQNDYVTDSRGYPILAYRKSASCDINLNLRCVADHDKGTLFTIDTEANA